MRRMYFAVLAAMIGGAGTASGQSMKPGLWGFNSKTQNASGELDKARADMQKRVASMPPDQRKMAEGIIAQRGMGMGAGGPGTMGMRACITKEMAERDEVPSQKGDCKTTTSPRAGTSVKMAFTCANPPSTGEGELTFISPEAFTMKMQVSNAASGVPEKTNMEQSGRWLSADCGAVKPIAAPGK